MLRSILECISGGRASTFAERSPMRRGFQRETLGPPVVNHLNLDHGPAKLQEQPPQRPMLILSPDFFHRMEPLSDLLIHDKLLLLRRRHETSFCPKFLVSCRRFYYISKFLPPQQASQTSACGRSGYITQSGFRLSCSVYNTRTSVSTSHLGEVGHTN